MTRAELDRYYTSGVRVDLPRDRVADVYRYTRRCTACGTWLDAASVYHGLPVCPGSVVARQRTVVIVRDGPDYSSYRWRRATAEERREALAQAG